MKAVFVLLLPLLPAAVFGCAPAGACLRLSDCATGSVCTDGACVVVSTTNDAESVNTTDEGGQVGASSNNDGAAATDAPSEGDAPQESSEESPESTDSAISDDGG